MNNIAPDGGLINVAKDAYLIEEAVERIALLNDSFRGNTRVQRELIDIFYEACSKGELPGNNVCRTYNGQERYYVEIKATDITEWCNARNIAFYRPPGVSARNDDKPRADSLRCRDEAIQLLLMLVEDLAKQLPDKERKLKEKILKGGESLSKNAVAELLSETGYDGCYNSLRNLF
ncbi:hypothetical protein [Endozoicomonas sp. Mp262]|uniref:hypothetical protein n=1 Tax=Endozoicomonas sp. Mp262 TaxID=2919499 RepID=UPI0021DF4EF4